MRAVLVTGAATPIGERLVRALLQADGVAHVLAVGFRPVEQALPFEPSSRLTYLQVDLGRSRDIRSMLFGPARDLGVDTVIHTPQQDSPSSSGRRVRALTVESTREILALSERHPTIRRLVYRSFAEVYRIQADLPVLIEEDHPLDLSPKAPQWIRDRVEADLTVCTRMGLSPLHIVVLRCAECLAPGTGSQLFDYLESPFCLHPAGFDPLINVITLADMVRAMMLATEVQAQGVFNIPGRDTLPLSSAILAWGRLGVPLPGSMLEPLYRLRRRLTGREFRYDMNRRRFHFSGVLDGTRAREILGYAPEVGVEWPVHGVG